MKQGKLYGIGVGPGDPELLTLKAVRAISKSDIILVPKSDEQKSTALAIANPHVSESAEVVELEFSMSKNIEDRIKTRKESASIIERYLHEGKNCAFLTLGDPMLYSTYTYVLQYIDIANVETIPGIYSFTAMSSALTMPLTIGDEQMAVLSDFSEDQFEVYQVFNTIVCMKISAYSGEVLKFLEENSNYSFICVSNAGKQNEAVYSDIEILKTKLPYFTTAILRR